MSRIGNKAVEIPDKVKVNIGNDGAVAVEGPKGKLNWTLPREIKASVADNQRLARPRRGDAQRESAARSFAQPGQQHGPGRERRVSRRTSRSKASVSRRRCRDQNLNLSLGFSHPVLFPIPKDIKITVTENTKISDRRHRQKSGRPGRGGYSPLLPAGALQGQRRALCGRSDSAQGRQDRSIVMARSIAKSSGTAFTSGSGNASAERRNVRVLRFIFPASMFTRR